MAFTPRIGAGGSNPWRPAPAIETLSARPAPGPATESNQRSILVIDDDPANFKPLRLAFKWVRFSSAVSVSVAESCERAVRALIDGAASLPSVIVLSLKRQGERCFGTLETLKSHEQTRHIPVIVWTERNSDVADKAYAAGANCVLLRPETVEEAELFLRRIEQFWFEAATLPSAKAAGAGRA